MGNQHGAIIQAANNRAINSMIKKQALNSGRGRG